MDVTDASATLAKPRILFANLAALVAVSGLLAAGTNSIAQEIGGQDFFAANGFGEGVAVVQHPAGEYHEGRTYVSYQGPEEDPYVAVYDHETGEWDGPYRAGISDLGKGPEFADRHDSHGKPTLLIDDAGYIHIFYGGHGGERGGADENTLGGAHAGDNKHAVSARPLDISEWEDLDNISRFGTYNQAIKMDSGDIYLFYRHGAHRSNWVYQLSTDNGRTFGEPVSFLERLRRDDIEATDSWYPWVTRGNGDEIIVSYDYHVCRDRYPGPHGHQGERHNLYYMVFDTADNIWRNVEGDELTLPVNRAMSNDMTLVFESDEMWTFNQSSALDNRGYPHIGIVMGPDAGERHGGPKAMRHFRWNGSEWVGGHDSGMPVSRGDIDPSSQDNVRFLLAYREQIDGRAVGTIGWWESEDGGETFVQGDVLLTIRGRSVTTSAFIRNAHPEARVIVAEGAPSGSRMRNMYLVGDNGPLSRMPDTR